MQSVVDISDITTISNTVYNNNTPTYLFKNDTNLPVRLSQIAVGVDSTFLGGVGKLQIFIAGNAITSKSSVSTEIGLLQTNLSVDFKENDFVILEPNAVISINARVTSGTSYAQFMITGTELTLEEYTLARNKYLGIVNDIGGK
jgi:hypothetical protein